MTVKRMAFPEDLRTSSDYLRMAVPLMIERKIPPTPYNYALWYAHVQQISPELSKALLEQFPSAGSYDHDKSESLFFEFFVKNYLPNNQQAQNLLVSIVSQLARAVSRNVKGTETYGSALKDAMEIFDAAVDQQKIRDMLTQLLTDTATVETLNVEFQLELQSARVEVEKLRRELEESQYSARFDTLTRIANRRAFNDAFIQALGMPEEPTCLLLLDLDKFKVCNDTYGHLMGDRILEIVGEILGGFQSDTIFVARYGGEEFTVIVKGSLAAAHDIAETIRQKVSAIHLKKKDTHDLIGVITVSIGLVLARVGETPEEIIGRADAALYRAKDQGRNCVVADGVEDAADLA
ncbi:GGDEF domain-containing protein [Thiocystis minor]|uniref:GGDEF domain-containing protein n=1 Tax=Thiocystis minor TaxID=61597 RepID=UPI001911FD9F|nr:GGDEF domain-containing protein [Thiocystis minor]MBK5967047.1 GGDEF domain-containing protein [Thiocystis minor]